MPISDGYEACRRIKSIYANSFSNLAEERDAIGQNNQYDEARLGAKPIFIACSAMVNEEVIEES